MMGLSVKRVKWWGEILGTTASPPPFVGHFPSVKYQYHHDEMHLQEQTAIFGQTHVPGTHSLPTVSSVICGEP